MQRYEYLTEVRDFQNQHQANEYLNHHGAMGWRLHSAQGNLAWMIVIWERPLDAVPPVIPSEVVETEVVATRGA